MMCFQRLVLDEQKLVCDEEGTDVENVYKQLNKIDLQHTSWKDNILNTHTIFLKHDFYIRIYNLQLITSMC